MDQVGDFVWTIAGDVAGLVRRQQGGRHDDGLCGEREPVGAAATAAALAPCRHPEAAYHQLKIRVKYVELE